MIIVNVGEVLAIHK